MLLIEIQENIIKAQNALTHFESDTIYKGYKTLGGKGKFEKELRNILSELIALRNSFISHVEAIIRTSENKELLQLIDSGYFDRYANAVSTESLIRIASFNDFKIPDTSMKVIAENKQAITEIQTITNEIKNYNSIIKDFRQERTKFYITLYKVPDTTELPDLITGVVNIENILPNTNVLSSYIQNKAISTGAKPKIQIQPKSEPKKITIVSKNENQRNEKIKIIKKK
jgi:hypothetical protein